MALIDERGRLAGKVNVIDAAAGLLVLMLIVMSYAGYALFRVPAVPKVTSVQPRQLTAGRDLRVLLRGENFVPFFRVYLQKSGQPAALSHRLDPRALSDAFTLSNRMQAEFFVESQTLAEVRLPDDTLPDTYDLVFYNETERVGLQERAFTIVPSLVPSPPSSATIRVLGAFTGLDHNAVKQFTIGKRFPEGGETPWAEVIAVEPPRPDVMRLQVGGAFVAASVEGRVRVPATLRIRCVPVDTRCRAGEVFVNPLSDIPIPLAGGTANFFIEEIAPDAPDAALLAELRVRFVVQPELAAMVKVGDIDRYVPAQIDLRKRAATLVAIQDRQELMSQTSLDMSDVGQVFGMRQRMVAFLGVLRVPVVESGGEWVYKSQALKAGGTLSFETPSYAIRGWILHINLSGSAAKPAGGDTF